MSASLIPEEDGGESFIMTLLTKDRTPGRSGNELKGAVISIVRGSCEETQPKERERDAAHAFFILIIPAHCSTYTTATSVNGLWVDLGKTF